MDKKRFSIVSFAFFCACIIPSVAQATTITPCIFDEKPYYPGQTGFLAVTLYNDQNGKSRITVLAATINYYCDDQVSYPQTFIPNATLSVQIQSGYNQTLYVPFSLPTNIAPGCTKLSVETTAQLYNNTNS